MNNRVVLSLIVTRTKRDLITITRSREGVGDDIVDQHADCLEADLHKVLAAHNKRCETAWKQKGTQ